MKSKSKVHKTNLKLSINDIDIEFSCNTNDIKYFKQAAKAIERNYNKIKDINLHKTTRFRKFFIKNIDIWRSWELSYLQIALYYATRLYQLNDKISKILDNKLEMEIENE